MLGVDRALLGADLENSARPFLLIDDDVRIAIETIFAGVFAGLNLDEADVEKRVLIGREGQRAANVNEADDCVGLGVIRNRMARPNLDPSAGSGDLAAFPGSCFRPRPALGRTNQ